MRCACKRQEASFGLAPIFWKVGRTALAPAFGSSATPRRIFAPSEIFCVILSVFGRGDELIRPGAIGQGPTAALPNESESNGR